MNGIPVNKEDALDLFYVASATSSLTVQGDVWNPESNRREPFRKTYGGSELTADRVRRRLTPAIPLANGILRGVQVFSGDASGSGTLKRGQLWAKVELAGIKEGRGPGFILAAGYVIDGVGLMQGHFEDPLTGPGFLDWTQEANDAAGNATTTVNLAATNARRLVRAVIVKVHSSGDVATRTWTITLRDLADSGGPTGWSIASDTWVSPTLTLTANEEGLMHLGEHGFMSVNDAGTLAYADNSSSPNPFPMMVEEGDSVDLIIAAGAGEAADDYDVWVQYEEWLEA